MYLNLYLPGRNKGQKSNCSLNLKNNVSADRIIKSLHLSQSTKKFHWQESVKMAAQCVWPLSPEALSHQRSVCYCDERDNIGSNYFGKSLSSNSVCQCIKNAPWDSIMQKVRHTSILWKNAPGFWAGPELMWDKLVCLYMQLCDGLMSC